MMPFLPTAKQFDSAGPGRTIGPSLLALLLCHCCISLPGQGVDADEDSLGNSLLPPAIAEEVRSIIRINDPRWVVDQVDTLITTMGLPDLYGRRLTAEVLFDAGHLRGIDLLRPSILAWRSGNAPLLAIIPIKDRAQFLDAFGQVAIIDRMLIRIGERDGTYIYSHNTEGGLDEYRLMILDGYAYLARTVSECRAMAEQPLPRLAEGPPLQVVTAGRAVAPLILQPLLQQSLIRRALGLSQDGIASWRDLLALTPIAEDLGQQINGMTLTAQPAEVGAAFDLRVDAVGDTPLALWIATQTNRSSRLLPLVARPGDLASVHGAVRWNGELESIGRRTIDVLQQSQDPAVVAVRERLTVALERDLRSYFRQLDDSSAFAASLAVRTEMTDPEIGLFRLRPQLRLVKNMPQAAEFITILRSVDLLFRPDRVGDFGAVAGLVDYRCEDGWWRHRSIADRSKLIQVGAVDRVDLESASNHLVQEASRVHNTAGSNGVVVVHVHVDEVARQLAVANTRSVHLPEALDIQLIVRSDGRQGLQISTELPVEAVGRALGQAGIVPTLDWRRAPELDNGTGIGWSHLELDKKP